MKEQAKETAKATEDISRKIASIQLDTKDSVEAIGTISGIINQSGDISATVASAVEEQNATTKREEPQCNRGGTKFRRNHQENLRGGSGASTSHGAGDSQKAAHELARMSGELKDLTAKFKF